MEGAGPARRPSTVRVLEAGVVGTLDYKIVTAERADDLYDWLKEHKYSYAGDEETLNFYVKKKWYFTVMKIDTMPTTGRLQEIDKGALRKVAAERFGLSVTLPGQSRR